MVLTLLIKLLPLLLPILRGLFGALHTTTKTYKLDSKQVQALVEKLTTEKIDEVVKAHAQEIVRAVPTDAEAAREKRLKELEQQLSKRQQDYETTNTKTT